MEENQLQQQQGSMQMSSWKQPKDEYLEKITTKVVNRGHSLTKMQVSRMLDTSSPFITQNPQEVKVKLIDLICVLFGVNQASISKPLLDAIFIALSDRFIGIRINDIEECFRHAQIEKKQYVSISRDEVIDPIQKYWNKKMTVLREIKDENERMNKDQYKQIKEQEFKDESLKVLKESLKQGSWLGTEFHANVLAKDYAIGIDKTLKEKFWNEAKMEYNQHKSQAIYNVFESLSQERIYAKKIMQEYVSTAHKSK